MAYDRTSYTAAAAYAQKQADETGFDFGVEDLSGPLGKSFSVFMLPGKQYRSGHELRCEVRSCTNPDKMRKGHGHK